VASLFPHPRRKSSYEEYREAWGLLDCTRLARGWKDMPAVGRCQQLAVRCAHDVEARLTLLLTYEGRTLLSVALTWLLRLVLNSKIKKTTPKPRSTATDNSVRPT
jgi:hypothetical protein